MRLSFRLSFSSRLYSLLSLFPHFVFFFYIALLLSSLASIGHSIGDLYIFYLTTCNTQSNPTQPNPFNLLYTTSKPCHALCCSALFCFVHCFYLFKLDGLFFIYIYLSLLFSSLLFFFFFCSSKQLERAPDAIVHTHITQNRLWQKGHTYLLNFVFGSLPEGAFVHILEHWVWIWRVRWWDCLFVL